MLTLALKDLTSSVSTQTFQIPETGLHGSALKSENIFGDEILLVMMPQLWKALSIVI